MCIYFNVCVSNYHRHRVRSGAKYLQPDLKYAGKKTIDFFVGSSVKARMVNSPSPPSRMSTTSVNSCGKEFMDKSVQKLKQKICFLKQQVVAANKECEFILQKQQQATSSVNKMNWCEQIQQERQMQLGLLLEQAIAENVCLLIKSLPHNSPLRRPLLACVLKGLSEKEAMDYFSLSKRTYARIISENNEEFFVSIKYKLKVKRPRLHPKALELVQKLADEKVCYLDFNIPVLLCY